MHVVAPTALLKLPAGQRLHVLEPAAGLKRPTSHAVQSVAPDVA